MPEDSEKEVKKCGVNDGVASGALHMILICPFRYLAMKEHPSAARPGALMMESLIKTAFGEVASG